MLPAPLRETYLVHDGAPNGVWALDADTLEFLWKRVEMNERTLETGAGMSTLLFALKRARHTCIVPSDLQVERVKRRCEELGVSTERIDFVVERSERALPRLALHDLDLVLIDGRHGFPAPILDWYYTAGMLRLGGTLVLDDTQLWPVRLVRDFLVADPGWRLDGEFSRTAVLTKLADGGEDAEWPEQPWVLAWTERLARRALWRARGVEGW